MKVTIYCGDTTFKWCPKSINDGIGGSEEAVIYLSEELQKLGHDITVVNGCKELEGEYSGIKYVDAENFKDEETDILIVWRVPRYILDLKMKTKKKYLWMHDMAQETELLPFQYLYDKIIILSNFHRVAFPHIDQERFYLSRNGIKTAQFRTKVKRIPNKIVYCSNYDRGLIILLENWTRILCEVPEAELYVMYGWQTLSTLSDKNNEEQEQFARFKDYINHLLDQDNIHHLGRVSHKELVKQLKEADIWAYPCIYPEISCISAMKAQEAGAYPVYLNAAALVETVKYGSSPDLKPPLINKMIEDKYIDTLIDVLKGEKREKKVKFDFDWSGVAKEWNNDLFVL